MKIADRYDKPAQIRRILIIQLGDIGDVVWSLPALQALRAAYPGAAVAVLLREGSGSLLMADAVPPQIFEVRKGLRRSLQLIRALRRERFDLLFDFRGDDRGGYMAFLSGAPIRAALDYPSPFRLRNHLFTHLVETAGIDTTVGAADLSFHILKAFGIEAPKAIPEIRLSTEVRLRAESMLTGAGIPAQKKAIDSDVDAMADGIVRRGGWVTLNPFSRWPYKEWDIRKWGAVVDGLSEEYEIATVIVGSPAERERAAELAALCSGRPCNLAGKTTLAELAGVLEQSRLHIGVDSAAPHIAAAVGTPTVTIYGPSDWRYWAPPGRRNRVVVPAIDCVPCHRKGCDGSGVSRCLDALPVEQVQAVIRGVLGG